MGKLMALSLATTLIAAVIFQPALMATQRKSRPVQSDREQITSKGALPGHRTKPCHEAKR
jgi:hypothetical protein